MMCCICALDGRNRNKFRILSGVTHGHRQVWGCGELITENRAIPEDLIVAQFLTKISVSCGTRRFGIVLTQLDIGQYPQPD
jgi:hypothetical protein